MFIHKGITVTSDVMLLDESIKCLIKNDYMYLSGILHVSNKCRQNSYASLHF